MAQRPPRSRDREQEPRGERSERYVYGVNPVLESLRAHPERVERLLLAEGQLAARAAAEILSRARDAGVRVDRVPRERLVALAEGGVHQGVVAELRGFEYAELPDLLEAAEASGRPPLLVVLDGIQDPHNFGAIIRSAHALGAQGVIIGKDRAVPVTGVVAKASAGAVEHCPIARVVNVSRALEELKEAGVWVAAADPHSDQSLWEARLDGPLAVVVGAEGAGVREGVLKHCDLKVRIPMLGQVGSLNASVSAAILLYEAARQRGARSGV
jgi:23S rRNA (guanosine2251-2'-O)-methyltransferase